MMINKVIKDHLSRNLQAAKFEGKLETFRKNLSKKLKTLREDIDLFLVELESMNFNADNENHMYIALRDAEDSASEMQQRMKFLRNRFL